MVWFALLTLLRLGGRKELAQLTPVDMLTMFLLSEAVSPAITGQDPSILAGLTAAAVLVGLTVGVDWLSFRSRKIELLVEGRADVLIRDGKVDGEVLRRHELSDAQLRTALHERGLLRVDEVRVAFVEPSGEITMVPACEPRGSS